MIREGDVIRLLKGTCIDLKTEPKGTKMVVEAVYNKAGQPKTIRFTDDRTGSHIAEAPVMFKEDRDYEIVGKSQKKKATVKKGKGSTKTKRKKGRQKGLDMF